MKTITRWQLFQTRMLCAAALALGILGDTKAHAQPGSEAWVQRYSNALDSSDGGSKVVTDADGNVIVAGNSNAGITGYDWLLIKYSNAGAPLWTNRYNGPGNGDDYAAGVAVDGSGNVFVTGPSDGGGTGFDYATIKYSGSGVPLWTNRYNGPGNNADQATALAVDGSGNLFVTGYSRNGTSYDYAAIAYSSAGVAWWTNFYNGPANSADEANAVAVDGNGNVFVTGFSDASDSGRDYATIAYSNAGVALWTNRYSGPGSYEDRAIAIAVDGSGNLFVTGYSTGGSGSDYVTIAYSNTGGPLWTNAYNGYSVGYILEKPTALAVDGSGNVFVTGGSYGGSSYADYATVAYSSTGVPLWTNRYNGPAGRDDAAYALAVDGSGNVFVTGSSYGDYATIAYSQAGVPLWVKRYNGPGNSGDGGSGVAVDASGNVFVTGGSYGGSSGFDCATFKYSAAGVPLWTNRYNGPGHGDSAATAVAVDGSGNVCVTGNAIDSRGVYHYATIKCSAAGVLLWANRYHGPANSTDCANALAVDGSGNVFVTGASHKNGNYYDYATIAYSSSGVPLWTNRYGGLANALDAANAVAVDGSGNVFVTGHSYGGAYGSGSTDDYATLAYSSAGVPLWTNRYDGPGNYLDAANAVAVDGSGNVFVTGRSIGSGTWFDFATIKYSGAGVPLWTNRYGEPGNGDDSANALAVDGGGNVVVTGGSIGSGSGYDYATIAYSSAGVPLWTNRYNASGYYSHDQANAVAVDGSGNVFVTGSSFGDYATIAYSSGGAPLWTNRYNGPGNGDDRASAVVVDGSGNVVVTGFSTGSGSGYDFATIAYSSAGVPLWSNRYNGPANGDETMSNGFFGVYTVTASHCLALAPDGVIVVGGSDGDFSSGTITDFAVVKYNIAIPLKITAAEKLGDDLRLSFTSQTGFTYIVQTRADLTIGEWINVVTNIPGGGALTQITVPNALLAPRQFYRIQQAP